MGRDLSPAGNARSIDVAAYSAMGSLEAFTISCWYRVPDVDTGNAYFISKRTFDTADEWIMFFRQTGTHAWRVRFTSRRWTTVGKWYFTDTDEVGDDWRHVAVTYSSSSASNDPVMYWKGSSQSVTEETAPVTQGSLESADLNYGDSSVSTRSFMGELGEFSYWSIILNAGEVSALAAGVSPIRVRPGNLVCWLPMIGQSDPEPNWAPVSGKNNGVLVGSPAQVLHHKTQPIAFDQPRTLVAAAAPGLPFLPLFNRHERTYLRM